MEMVAAGAACRVRVKAKLDEVPWTVAVMVTVWVVAMVAGAVYVLVVCPLVIAVLAEKVPALGLALQSTAVAFELTTSAVNVACCPPFRLVLEVNALMQALPLVQFCPYRAPARITNPNAEKTEDR